jgi:hypothetical protein
MCHQQLQQEDNLDDILNQRHEEIPINKGSGRCKLHAEDPDSWQLRTEPRNEFCFVMAITKMAITIPVIGGINLVELLGGTYCCKSNSAKRWPIVGCYESNNQFMLHLSFIFYLPYKGGAFSPLKILGYSVLPMDCSSAMTHESNLLMALLGYWARLWKLPLQKVLQLQVTSKVEDLHLGYTLIKEGSHRQLFLSISHVLCHSLG